VTDFAIPSTVSDSELIQAPAQGVRVHSEEFRRPPWPVNLSIGDPQLDDRSLRKKRLQHPLPENWRALIVLFKLDSFLLCRQSSQDILHRPDKPNSALSLQVEDFQ